MALSRHSKSSIKERKNCMSLLLKTQPLILYLSRCNGFELMRNVPSNFVSFHCHLCFFL